MNQIKRRGWRIIGLVGVIVWLGVFVDEPSFPSLDKLIFLLVFFFMIFGQAIEVSKRFVPFVALVFVYESFRSVADKLNTHVNYSLAPHIDKLLFGNLPTTRLQNWLWHGHVRWYDYTFYLAYMCHFIMPVILGVIVWKTREKQYWRVIWTYLVVAFGAFFTFLMLPAAPPWLASQNHYIEPIVRISSQVWASLGIHDFPTIYQHIAPNQVAAIPSLHAAWATVLIIFVYKLYGRRWAALAAIYPLFIYIGTIYQGEHYAFDIIVGVFYGALGYAITPWIMRCVASLVRPLEPAARKLPVLFRLRHS